EPKGVYGGIGSGGVYSAIRGHSLARSIFGWNDAFIAAGGNNPNTTPFNGAGRWHTGAAGSPWSYMNPLNTDDYSLPNFTFFQGDGWIRDPEKLPPNLAANPTALWRTDTSQAPGPYAIPYNAPYTYPNENNMYLAPVRAAGTV